jgi:D-alanine-D-alanine ligase
MRMRIVIAHNDVPDTASPDEHDVLVQAAAVAEALKHLGHDALLLPCSLDLDAARRRLETMQADLVFNLVESLAGHGRLIHLFPALLDAMKIAYTGSCTEAIFTTSNKVLAKERMAAAALPTPAWIGPYPLHLPTLDSGAAVLEAQRWIVKSLWEHASIGLDDDVLVSADSTQALHQILAQRAPALGSACFAEAFIEGREFNLSLLAGLDGPEVLPPAEIIFEGFDRDRPRIVGYRAKWDAQSYEYHHTPRRFEFPPADNRLLEELRRAAVRCWQVFGLGGYARVDFRVDARKRLWILEINTNPCLSPDAGYAAAVAQAGMPFPQVVARILDDALDRQRHR